MEIKEVILDLKYDNVYKYKQVSVFERLGFVKPYND